MKNYIFMGFVFLASLVGCNTKADDGVGETPKESTQDTFYFRNGMKHTITMLEHETKELEIVGVSDDFTATETTGGIAVSKATKPTKIVIKSQFAGTYLVTIKDGEKTAEITVVVNEKENTKDTFYFRNGGKYAFSLEEKQKKELNLVGVSDKFEITENSGGGITVVKGINPAKLAVNAYKMGTYTISVKDGDKTAEIIVTVTERDTGWRDGVFTIENIDGDKTEKDSEDFVELEHLGYTYIQDDILPASARDRIRTQVVSDKIRVTAVYHYDEPTPITFSIKNAAGDKRTVKIKRVTKFWYLSGNNVIGLLRPEYITQNSFDQLTKPPKMPYAATYLSGNYFGEGSSYTFVNNLKITKVDLNNVEYVTEKSFYGCKNLKEVIAPKVKIIYRIAFAQTGLTKIELPKVERIDENAFYQSPIQFLHIGDQLKYLYAKSLMGIESTLQEVRIGVTTPSQLSVFDNSYSAFITPNGAKLLVPSTALRDWQSRYPWLETVFKGGLQGF